MANTYWQLEENTDRWQLEASVDRWTLEESADAVAPVRLNNYLFVRVGDGMSTGEKIR